MMSVDDQLVLVINGGNDKQGGGVVGNPLKHDCTGLNGLTDDDDVDNEQVITGEPDSDVLCLRDLRTPCNVLYRLKHVARLR